MKIPVRTTTMASRFTGREKKDDNRIHSAPVTRQRNSKIPIRLTRLSSANHEGSSLEDKTVKKRPFPKDSGKKRSSRIPVAVDKTGILNFSVFFCVCVRKIDDSNKNTFYRFNNKLVHLVTLKLLEINSTH